MWENKAAGGINHSCYHTHFDVPLSRSQEREKSVATIIHM